MSLYISLMETILAAGHSFKQVPGGFVYRAPNPWIFGTADHCLVDEAQKAEILRITSAGRPVLWVVFPTVVLAFWIAIMATIDWAFAGQEDPTPVEVMFMIIGSFAAFFAALHVTQRLKLRRLQPILAGLPRSDRGITPLELPVAEAKAVSFKAALWIGILSTVACAFQLLTLVMRNSQHPLFSDAQSLLILFALVCCGALAGRFFRLAIGKTKHRPPAV